jgi:hypothetical protein
MIGGRLGMPYEFCELGSFLFLPFARVSVSARRFSPWLFLSSDTSTMGALIPVAGAIILVELDQDCVRMVKVPEVGFGGRSFRSAVHCQSLKTVLETFQAVRQLTTSGFLKVSSGWR